VGEKEDIAMPELASDLKAAVGVRADPASLSRWLIRNDYQKNAGGQQTKTAQHPKDARGMDRSSATQEAA
jgi:hypothetical protein